MQCFVHILDVQTFGTNEFYKRTRGFFQSAVNFKIIQNCLYFASQIFSFKNNIFRNTLVYFLFVIKFLPV